MSLHKGRRPQRDECPEIDLLCATFNLPMRQDIQRQQQRSTQRVTLSFESNIDQDDQDDQPDFESSIDSDSDDYGNDDNDDYKSIRDDDDSVSEDSDQHEPQTPTPTSASVSKTEPKPKHKLQRQKRTQPVPRERCLKLEKAAAGNSPMDRLRERKRSRRLRKKKLAPLETPLATSLQSAPLSVPRPSLSSQSLSDLPDTSVSQPAAAFLLPKPIHAHFQNPQFAYPPTPNFAQVPQYMASFSQQPSAFQQTGPAMPYSYQRPLRQATGQATRTPLMPLAHEIQQVQLELDQKIAECANRPGDPVLERQLKALRDRLNSTLNTAMAQRAKSENYNSRGMPTANLAKTNYTGVTSSRDPRAGDEPKLTSRSTRSHDRAEMPGTHVNEQRGESLERPRHHICFGCGSVRSVRYHQKYPLASGQNIRNLCEGCRDAMHQKGVLGDRHVCFGCGRVRSKRFHCKHPANTGDPLLPNYCSPCTKEIRDSEDIADASMVNWTVESGSKDNKVDNHETERMERTHRAIPRRGRKPAPNTCSRATDPRQPHNTRQESQRGAVKDASQSPLGVEDSGKTTVASQYRPDRSHGSFKRRTQRTSSKRRDSPLGVCTEESEDATKYRPPYVEDVISQVRSTKSGDSTDDNPPTDIFEDIAQAGEHIERKSHRSCLADTSRDGLSSPDGSPNSAESSNSTRSSDSKSVRFNPAVKVRTFCFRAASNMSLDSHLESDFIKPDDNSKPSRAGIYGDIPLMDKYGRPLSTFESLRVGDQHSNENRSWYGGGPIAGFQDHRGFQDHQIPEPLSSEKGAFSDSFGFKPWNPSEFRSEVDDFSGAFSPSTSRRSSPDGMTEEKQGFQREPFKTFEASSQQGYGVPKSSHSSPHTPKTPVSSFFRGVPDWSSISDRPTSPQSAPATACGQSDPKTTRDASNSHRTWGSEPSFKSSGGVFSSFDDETYYQSEHSNPYYTPPPRRKYDFYQRTFHSGAREKPWNEYESIPEPIIEEAESEIGSPVKSPVLLLDDVPAVPALDFSEGDDAPDVDELTSDEEPRKEAKASE